MQPETIHAYLWRERYVAFYGDIDDGTGFIFDPRAADKGLVLLTGDRVAAGFRAPSDDILYVAMKNDDPAPDNWGVFEFGEGNSDKTLEWRSKEFLVEKPVNMVCGRVEADAYPVQFSITVDGVQKADFAVPDAKTFRLPRGFLGRRWQFKVSGTRQVSLIGLWDSMSEVQ